MSKELYKIKTQVPFHTFIPRTIERKTWNANVNDDMSFFFTNNGALYLHSNVLDMRRVGEFIIQIKQSGRFKGLTKQTKSKVNSLNKHVYNENKDYTLIQKIYI